MISISCDNLSLSFGIDTILENVSFSLNDGDRLGIVGVNGAGKSTLFRLITGEYKQDTGAVYIAKDKTVGLLEQNTGLDSEKPVYEEMLSSFPALVSLEQRIADTQAAINAYETERKPHDDAFHRLISDFSEMNETFESEGGYSYKNRIRAMLTQMGFGEEFWDIPIAKLSGGQKTRLALVRLLLWEPDILMLDEPTNHLDIDTLSWLEEHLRGYKKTILVVSHDRYFLDKITNKILEIEHKRGTLYNGNYSSYLEQKAKNREVEEKHYQNQQREIARIEAYIEQQRRWNRERNIIAAESRQKQLDKMVKLDKPNAAPDKIRLQFSKSGESGNDVLELNRLSKAYPGKPLFSDVSAMVKKHDHVFVYGPNGCGKSTLLKIIMGRVAPDRGDYEYGYNVTVGYYDQEQQELDENNTVLEELWSEYENLTQTEIRNTLALFLFRGDDIEKKVSVLSGGEKARLTLAKLILSKMNVLILDEPTNHLDIPSREALETALLAFDGTIIAVSHDRYFINKLANRIFDLSDHTLADFRGTYEEYLAYKERQKTGNASASGITAGTPSAAPAEPLSAGKEQFLKNKADAAQRRKEERARQKTADAIAKTEREIEDIDEEMAGDASSDYKRLSELQTRKDELEEQLLLLYEEAEALG
ncbi:MAG: ABC-F family ATP-binding cassette domain-containing protein [Clostridia bacterium]|nr:ABC-F family ATP-binding cassette domain-containing protein [Clostridia bacterium]